MLFCFVFLKYSTENAHQTLVILIHLFTFELPFSLSSLFTDRKYKVKAALKWIFQKGAWGKCFTEELKPEHSVFGQSNEVTF